MLLDDLESNHLRPPVMRVVTLESRLRSAVGIRAEISILLLRAENSLHPYIGLVDKRLVIEYVCKRKKAVNPIRSPLPCVAVTTEPRIPLSYHIRIVLIEMAGKTGTLSLELKLKPTLSLDVSKRKLHVSAFKQRSPVRDIVLSGSRGHK